MLADKLNSSFGSNALDGVAIVTAKKNAQINELQQRKITDSKVDALHFLKHLNTVY